jgi:hypothetical protein
MKQVIVVEEFPQTSSVIITFEWKLMQVQGKSYLHSGDSMMLDIIVKCNICKYNPRLKLFQMLVDSSCSQWIQETFRSL